MTQGETGSDWGRVWKKEWSVNLLSVDRRWVVDAVMTSIVCLFVCLFVREEEESLFVYMREGKRGCVRRMREGEIKKGTV